MKLRNVSYLNDRAYTQTIRKTDKKEDISFSK